MNKMLAALHVLNVFQRIRCVLGIKNVLLTCARLITVNKMFLGSRNGSLRELDFRSTVSGNVLSKVAHSFSDVPHHLGS